jgi:hypothetical protein
MRLARNGAREAEMPYGCSSVQRAIRKDVYDAEAVTQAAEDQVNIEPGRTQKVYGPAAFDTKVVPLCAD